MLNLYHQDKSNLQKLFQQKSELNVAIVGFGYIGCCIGAVLADKGIKVVGIEPREVIINAINKGICLIKEPELEHLIQKNVANGKLFATTEYSAIKSADIIIVTVGTPLADDFSPQMKDIEAASLSIGEYLQKGQIVILKSTVPPFTTENIVKPILEEKSGLVCGKDFGLAFSPERLAEGRAVKELNSIPIIVGGIDEQSAQITSEFWKNILGVETIIVSQARTAEMSKLADNLWIDLNIAIANELAQICSKINVDVIEVIKAANSLPKVKGNVNILLPSMGVGGYCLTKDPWFVYNFGKKYGLELKTPVTSRQVNDYMPKFTFELIRDALKESGKELSSSKVAVLGLSFKSNTGDIRFTPTKYTLEHLKNSDCELAIFDPWVNAEETKQVIDLEQAVNIEEAVRNADVVAFFTGHPEFINYPKEKLKSLIKSDCWLIDGRNIFDPQQMKKEGFNYKGIGR